MKKIISLLIIMASLFLVACTEKKELEITGLDTVQVNATIKLEAVYNFASTDEILWETSDENIATVNGGIVKGVGEGKVTITVSIANFKATKELIVTKAPFSITVTGSNKIFIGETMSLIVETTPVVDKLRSYSSSNDNIATVNEEGMVTGVGEGTVTITVMIDGITSDFDIEVLKREVLEIVISGDDYVRVGQSIFLTSNIDVFWKSSNDDIAEVYEDGEIIAVSSGVVTITATDKNDSTNTKDYQVTVIGKVPSSLVISGRNKVSINQSTLLTVSAYPEGANNQVIWSSKNEEIAIVDQTGVVTGVGLGKTTIKVVSSDDANVISIFSIEVIEAAPSDIDINGDTEVIAGNFIYLNLEVTGGDVSKQVIWTTSDKKVLIVDDGIVLGLTAGEAIVRATSILNDQVYDEMMIIVNKYIAPNASQEDLDYVNNILKDLTLDEKIGQMLIGSYNGTTMSSDAINAIENYKLGNFIHMAYNVPDGATAGSFTTEIQNKMVSTTGIPGFICIDQEGGRVTRLTNGGTRFIGNMAIAATNDPNNAYLVGAATGEELKNYGINFDLAPVLDVNNNPNNPVINNRSYSDNAITVSLFGRQMIAGLASSSVMSCAKHFPGHGNTSTDSHTSLPKITSTKEDLYAIELAPFISAIASGIDSIMTTHIIFSAIDKEYPATLSKAVLTDLLRNELGFDGIIVTDGMEMAAIANNYGVGQAAVLAVKAGADLLAYTTISNPITAHQSIKAAVMNGEITEERIDESVRRILLKKLKYDLFDNYLPSENYADYDLSDHLALNLAIAKKSVTVHLGEFNGLDSTKSTLILSSKASITLETGLSGSDNSFGYIASQYLKSNGFKKCDYFDISSLTSARVSELVAITSNYEQVVIAVNDANSLQISLVNQVSSGRDDLIVVALNLPYDINKYANTVNNYICIYEYTPVMVDALKRLMNGEYQATGSSSIVLNK